MNKAQRITVLITGILIAAVNLLAVIPVFYWIDSYGKTHWDPPLLDVKGMLIINLSFLILGCAFFVFFARGGKSK